MHRRHFMLCLLIALLLASFGPGDVRAAWPDGDLAAWNVPGMAVPDAPSAPYYGPMSDRCGERTAETAEDAEVVASGWRLTTYGVGHGSDIDLIGGFINYDANCRPVPYQWFAFVDGEFAGTLAPNPMYPRTDESLVEAEILDADHVRAVYDRYGPSDALCCPSGQTEVAFRIDRTANGPVVVPDVDSNESASGNGELIAVCVNLGGDALSLYEWTPEELADYEDQFGPAQRPHPATGICADPAGLPLFGDIVKTFSWVCVTHADGLWYGPGWTAPIYLPENAVPPDPAIGGGPTPRGQPSVVVADTQQAAATAVYLSQLEAAGDIDTLYEWMHPDAKMLVPKAAVAGWYTANFLPLGPQPISVSDVELTAWTWNVSGATYERTAVVSFTQAFADGSVYDDVIRLVQDDQGTWCWFFGRDAAFVNDQIDRYVD